MILDPFRLYRRWQRLEQEALEEARVAKLRHGEEAAWALRMKLTDPSLTRWGRKVLKRAIQRL